MYVEPVFLVACKHGVAVGVADATVVLLLPDVADGRRLRGAHGIVGHLLLAEALAAFLRHYQLRFGKVGLHHLRVVLVVVQYGVSSLCDLAQRVCHLLQHVGQVNLRQRDKLDVVIVFDDLNALGDVFQRRQQGGELARLRVGFDVDVLRFAALACPCAALYGGSVALEGALLGAGLVVVVVEQQVLAVHHQRDAGLADVVVRRAEAHGQRVVLLTATDTAHEVHQRRVLEVVGYRGAEVVFTGNREASASHYLVPAELGLNIVFADGHADPVLSIGIGLRHLAVVGLQLTVDI